MFEYIFYFFAVFIFGLFVPLSFIVYSIFSIYVDFKGAPYVPTSSKLIDEILKEANLKRDQVFLELGSGDGRIVREAVKKYQVKGIGVEIHPMLIIYSKIVSGFQKLKNISFKREDLFRTDFSKAGIIFMFLMPKTIIKLKEKFKNECKKSCLVISHGFKIEGWDKYLVKKQSRSLFPTYFYKSFK